MKKIALVVIALALAVVLGTAVMAQEAMKVTGWVSKIDTEAVSVRILPEGGTAVTVIMGDAESLSKVAEGDKAEARYRVKDGKNMGRWLHKITDGGCP
jgi:Cu/Ag efflux protein CusF